MSTLALQVIYDALANYFAARERQVELVFGFGARNFNVTTRARIAMEPGNGVGALRTLHSGTSDPQRQTELDETVFGSFVERFQLYIFAHDRTAPADVFQQCFAARVLHDAVCDAISQSNLPVTFDGAEWVVSSEVLQHGAAIVLRGAVVSLMVGDPLDKYREVLPWTALTRVHAPLDELVEGEVSPPLPVPD